jgi:hypothetical protein
VDHRLILKYNRQPKDMQGGVKTQYKVLKLGTELLILRTTLVKPGTKLLYIDRKFAKLWYIHSKTLPEVSKSQYIVRKTRYKAGKIQSSVKFDATLVIISNKLGKT